MNIRSVFGVAMALALSGCVSVPKEKMTELPAPQASTASAIQWEVVNRNRLINGEVEEKRFNDLLAWYVEDYREWFRQEEYYGQLPNFMDTDLLHGRRSASKPPRNIEVRYDPTTARYGTGAATDWTLDQRRQVRLSYPSAPAGAQCEWDVGGAVTPKPCAERFEQDVMLDQTVEVRVRVVGAADWSNQEPVTVRDLRIVALGDSFSAGEGNPHSQWRFFFTAAKHPSMWLDARCHRSLMSGPALTAAYLARTQPHMSVTLMHYGCSGASIADGVAAPWPLLETSTDIERQYKIFGIKGDAYKAERVAGWIDRGDIPPSQIDQAVADLGGANAAGQVKHKPDIVLLSVGGNDVGFGTIVAGLIAPGVDDDLKSEFPQDNRPYASFDEAAWAESGRIATQKPACLQDKNNEVDCMGAHVAERLGPATSTGRDTLVSQYGVLRTKLTELAFGTPERVLITTYPDFLRYEKGGLSLTCADRQFDNRPGLMPGPVALIPGFGMKEGMAERSETLFLNPLNERVAAAAEASHWTLVDSHRVNGMANGYCAFQRYYNTLTDSYWTQGRRYSQPRPVGNITALQPHNPLGLERGEKAVWRDRCYVRSGREECLGALPESNPTLKQLKRNAVAKQAGQVDAKMIKGRSEWLSSGPVHPNLFGHCNYASAMVTSIVRNANSQPLKWDDALLKKIADAGPAGLKADDVCSAKAWGWSGPSGR